MLTLQDVVSRFVRVKGIVDPFKLIQIDPAVGKLLLKELVRDTASRLIEKPQDLNRDKEAFLLVSLMEDLTGVELTDDEWEQAILNVMRVNATYQNLSFKQQFVLPDSPSDLFLQYGLKYFLRDAGLIHGFEERFISVPKYIPAAYAKRYALRYFISVALECFNKESARIKEGKLNDLSEAAVFGQMMKDMYELNY